MNEQLKKEELEYIRKLLSSKPKPQLEETKKWIDREVRVLLSKYRGPKKLF